MAIITPALLQGLKTGFKAEYAKGLSMVEPMYQDIATTILSATASNTYGWLGQFPQLREWIGDRQIKDMAAHGYQIVNKLYESTVGVKRTDIEDDNLGVYAPLIQEMGRAAAAHPDELVFDLLRDAHTVDCYDGKKFFATDHQIAANVDGTGALVTVSNSAGPGLAVTPAWFLLDTSRAIKPLIFQQRLRPELQALTDTKDESVFTKDQYRYGVRVRHSVGVGFWQMAYRSQQTLNAENFGKAYDAMLEMKTDGMRPLAIKPTVLVVPVQLRAAAVELLKMKYLPGGGSNPNYEIVKLIVSPWL